MVERERFEGRLARSRKPVGWYSKDQRDARSAAFRARKAARQAEREAREQLIAEQRRLRAAEAERGLRDTRAARQAEAGRVAALLARTAAHRTDDQTRALAAAEARAGRFVDPEVVKLGPTPEQLAKGPFEPILAEKIGGDTRTVHTVRRVTENRVKQLHDRGVLTDDTYPAVLWYRRQWEGSGFGLGASSANWGERIVGEPSYGAMPRTAAAAECRHLFRFARGGSGDGFALPPDMLPTFDLVVLHELTISDAATIAKCRYSRAATVVQHVALLLLGRISHLLPVRAVGAPGSEPVADPLPGFVATDQALSNAVAEIEAGVRQVPPEFVNGRGFLRPGPVIAKILRGEDLSDEELAA